MEAYLNEVAEWVFTLSPFSIYSVFFIIAYLENIIPPIPGDLLVVFGGYLAAERIVGFANLLLLTSVASVIGFMSMYGIGSYWGYRIDKEGKRFWLMRIIDIKYFDKGKRWMHQWGQWAIVANRFLAGTRSVIALTAGIYRTKINYTILSCFTSSMLWNSVLLGIGWLVHENWQIIGDYLKIYGWVILVGILAFVIVRFLLFRERWRENYPE